MIFLALWLKKLITNLYIEHYFLIPIIIIFGENMENVEAMNDEEFGSLNRLNSYLDSLNE